MPTLPVKAAWVSGGVAFAWFLALSAWLGVAPGTPIVTQPNVFFNADTSRSIARLADPKPPFAQAHRYLVHPFELWVWRPICRLLVGALQLAMPFPQARIIAPRCLVAFVAAVGVAALASFALAIGIPAMHAAWLFAAYLFFTSNLLVVVPENEGFSSGLLALSFWLWSAGPSTRRRTMVLVGTAMVTAGTTVTNGVFGVMCLAYDRSRSALRAVATGFAALTALAGVTLVLAQVSVSVGQFVRVFMNGRLIHDVPAAVTYMAWTVIAPAIGPAPRISDLGSAKIVSYEPFSPFQYSGLQGIGAVAWLALFAAAAICALRDERTRVIASVLISWVAFNGLLHNVWGDEFFLYTPHWGWALMALVVVGVKTLHPLCVPAAVIALIPGQLQTLSQIRTALHSLTP